MSHQEHSEFVGLEKAVRKDEFVNLIIQELHLLGYCNSAAALKDESRAVSPSTAYDLIGQQILDGKWEDCISAFQNVRPLDESMVTKATVLLLEQQALELFLSPTWYTASEAPIIMRKIAELHPDWIQRNFEEEARSFSTEQTGIRVSRMNLQDKLLVLLPKVKIPWRRLENLVEQAIIFRRDVCMFNSLLGNELSLYNGHYCGKEHAPPFLLHQELPQLRKEPAFLKYSNNGQYLASASECQRINIWEVSDVRNMTKKCELTSEKVIAVSWSSDDRQVLTCGLDGWVRRWALERTECVSVYKQTGVSMVSCGFFSDGNVIFAGGNDGILERRLKAFQAANTTSIFSWSLEGELMEKCTLSKAIDVLNMEFCKKKNAFIGRCVAYSNMLLVLDWNKKHEQLLEETGEIRWHSLSTDNSVLLVSVVNEELHLWEVTESSYHRRSKLCFSIGCSFLLSKGCFGGLNEGFIACGSEESNDVFIWHRHSGMNVAILRGHEAGVKKIAWNPTNVHELTSASSDGFIKIWRGGLIKE